MHELLTIRLFGAPQIALGERPITDFITRKAEALFLYLATTLRPHTRDALATLLWPEEDSQRAKKNLRDVLPNLRDQLGDYLVITRDSITFNTHNPKCTYWVDLQNFQTHLQHSSTNIEEIHTAVNLYRGEFLEGFHVRSAPNFEEWMLLERERFHKSYIQSLDTLAAYHIDQQDYFAALVVTQRLLAIEPWQEKAHRQQMISLAGSGRVNEALAQYATCQRILADELGLEPMAETTALYEQIRNGTYDRLPPWVGLIVPAPSERQAKGSGVDRSQPDDKMAPKRPDSPAPKGALSSTLLSLAPPPYTTLPPHNLPRQLTPFFGRAFEMRAICAKLQQPDCAWLTLTGVGGVGKTRLALKVGETLLPYFPDGVWFVSLLDIIPDESLAEHVVTAIGKALQISFTGAESLTPQLFAYLRDKQLLLILDNFEHLSGAADGSNTSAGESLRNPAADCVYQLLQETQHVKVLITSRHSLNYQVEHLFTLDGLPLPESEEIETWSASEQTTEQLLTYDSIALFAQRAAHSIAHFALNPENATAIMQICRLVEGLPLGIELAATLVRRYSCDQIASRLQDHYTILSTTFHDLPMRHRSIEATLAYSWQLLSAADRLSFAQCAIFPDSFTQATAAAVTGTTEQQLQRLERQMLLQQVAPKRYTMHRLMRQYALQQLQQMPTLEQQVRERHCFYFVEFLNKLAERSSLDAQSFDIIHAEMGDIYIGWEWATQQSQFELLRQMLPPLVRIYTLSGSHREIATLLGQTTASLRQRFGNQENTTPAIQQIMAQLLLEQAYFYITSEHIEQAKPLIEEALHLAHGLGDATLTMTAYVRSGDAAWAQGDYTQHRLAYEQALVLARTLHHYQREVHCLSNLGMNDDMLCEYSRAIQSYEAALTLTRHIGDREKENVIYNNLGVSSALLGHFTKALTYYQETLQLSRQLGDQEGSGFANLNLGLLYNTLGEWERARYYGERALKIFRMINDRRLEARTLAQLGFAFHQMAESATAASYAQQALQIAHKGGYQAVQAEVLTVWGQILLDRQESAKAAKLFQEAYTLWQVLGRMRRSLLAQGGLVDSYYALGEQRSALRLVNEILEQVTVSTDKAALPPESVLLSCYRVLQANSDGRAMVLLQRAHQLLMAKADQLQDQDLRYSFLYQVKVHRELVALAQGIGTKAAFDL